MVFRKCVVEDVFFMCPMFYMCNVIGRNGFLIRLREACSSWHEYLGWQDWNETRR